MKRAAIVLVLLVFIGGCSASGQYDQSANEPPEYLPLPERATEELQALGIKMYEDKHSYGPSEKIGPGFKPRLTTHDRVTGRSAIWDVQVEAMLHDKYGNYEMHFEITLMNKTDAIIKVEDLIFNFNPQLEYHYTTRQTFFDLSFGRPTHLGPLLVIHPLGAEGEDRIGADCRFKLHPDNPFHLPASELRQKFDIFFRDLYIITEWDGGREVYMVNPDDIEFRKELNKDGDGEDIQNED